MRTISREELVDRELYMAEGLPAFGRSPNNDESWFSLLQKAVASANGGYESLNGGDPSEGLRLLTGERPTLMYQCSPEGIEGQLKRNRPILVGITKSYESADWMMKNGILQNHVYAVLDVVKRGGEKFLKLYNPTGYYEPGAPDYSEKQPSSADGRNDGVFEIEFSRARRLFNITWMGRSLKPI